jgi:hypothetical protein
VSKPKGTRAILSPQRRKFAREYLRTGNITKAALNAGYSPKTATVQGSQLLSSLNVQSYLAGRIAKEDLEAETFALEVARQAFEELPDIGDFLDEHGNLRPLKDLTIEQRRSIASIEVVKKNLAAGDGKTDTVVKLKQWNIRAERTKSQELLARVMKWVNNEPAAAPQVSIFAIAALPALSPAPTLVIDAESSHRST